MSKSNIKSVYIKLGASCNLHCKYCHAESKVIHFNPEILPVLKGLNLRQVHFGGGEPLLYWDTIRKITEYLGKTIQYKIVTNGTLFTQEIVDFCNQYNFFFHISLDGIHTTRDTSKPICWDLIKQLRFCGTAVTFYKENSNILETLNSLNDIKRNYLTVGPAIWSSFPNFVHSTSKTGILSDRALADSYIAQLTIMLRRAIWIYKERNGHTTIFLKRAFHEFVQKKSMNGVFCCNDESIAILADGTICVCPYTYEKAGDVFHLDKIDWNIIKDLYTKETCKTCELFHVCGNRCCMDVTDNQCYIMRNMHKNFVEIMKKNGITYEEFERVLSMRK